MPVYEYQCTRCRRKITVLARSIYHSTQPVCPLCGGDTFRLFSTFITRRTFQDDYEDILSDGRLVRGLENNDPRALAEWGRKMSRSMESDGVGPEWEEMMSNLEKERMPEELGEDEGAEDTAEGE